MKKIKLMFLLTLVLSLCSVAITYSSWVSPNETGNDVIAPLNTGDKAQIRRSELGLTSGVSAPSGAPKNAIDLYNGSLFVRNGGYNPNNWTASSDFTIDTPNVIASHGVTSAGNIQATRFLVTDDLSGGVSSKRVCANEQGKLVLCAVTVNPDPVINPVSTDLTLTGIFMDSDGDSGYSDSGEDPIQLTWVSTNATSCKALTGTGFSTSERISGMDMSNNFSGLEEFSLRCSNSTDSAVDTKSITQRKSVVVFKVDPLTVATGNNVTAVIDTNAQTSTGGQTFCAKRVDFQPVLGTLGCTFRGKDNAWSGEGSSVYGPWRRYFSSTFGETASLSKDSFVSGNCSQVKVSLYVKCYNSSLVEESHNTISSALEKKFMDITYN